MTEFFESAQFNALCNFLPTDREYGIKNNECRSGYIWLEAQNTYIIISIKATQQQICRSLGRGLFKEKHGSFLNDWYFHRGPTPLE
jgi:hypothetical protein